jgi:hypothetical protein
MASTTVVAARTFTAVFDVTTARYRDTVPADYRTLGLGEDERMEGVTRGDPYEAANGIVLAFPDRFTERQDV